MNKIQYLNELKKRLKYLPKEDRDDAIEYYTELISDMGIEEGVDISEKLGSPKDAAKKILDECTQKHVTEYEENKTAKGRATIIWLTVLGILSLPVSLPLAIAVLAVAFAVIVVILVLFVTLVVVAVAFVIAGIAGLVWMWFLPMLAQRAVIFGAGLCMLGLGVLMNFGLFFFVRMIGRRIFRRI